MGIWSLPSGPPAEGPDAGVVTTCVAAPRTGRFGSPHDRVGRDQSSRYQVLVTLRHPSAVFFQVSQYTRIVTETGAAVPFTPLMLTDGVRVTA